MNDTASQIRSFIQYIAVQLISRPDQAELRVAEVEPGSWSFRLILHQDDVAPVIGRSGFTASAIRNLIKGASERGGIKAQLRICSHEEEQERLEREGH